MSVVTHDTVLKKGKSRRGRRKGVSALKKIKLETGLELQVPLFIEVGDTIRVDTRTGEYVTRV